MSKEDQNKQHKGAKPEGKGPAKEKKGAPSGPKKGPVKHEAPEVDAGPRVPPRLKVMFDETVRAGLGEQFGLKNRMAQPRIQKIVVNVNMGRHIEGAKIPPHIRGQVLETINKVTGQRPVVLKAKKSVSNFKVREGLETAAMVTMRRDRMWHFLDRLINLATPRIKDFRGLPDKAFDKQGNYAMGLTEQGVFPEINMAEAQFTHGMNINVCFSNSSPKLSKFVLEQLGMPFRKPDQK
jgi:large subunit ribosomal protein L5